MSQFQLEDATFDLLRIRNSWSDRHKIFKIGQQVGLTIVTPNLLGFGFTLFGEVIDIIPSGVTPTPEQLAYYDTKDNRRLPGLKRSKFVVRLVVKRLDQRIFVVELNRDIRCAIGS